MKTDGANEVDERLKLLLRLTDSDLAAYGAVNPGNRKLQWLHIEGGISRRTELIRQRLTLGLTGAAIRSGRLHKVEQGSSAGERFKLGEAILLTEKLWTAAAIPVNCERNVDSSHILLIGRRRDISYQELQLKEAETIAKQMSNDYFPDNW